MKRFTKIIVILILSTISLFGFSTPLNIFSSNWYNQYLPNLNNRPLSDITFIDSLLGFAVIGNNTSADTNYIIKTINGGDNWFKLDSTYGGISRIIFLNANTGFVGGGSIYGGFIYKTTNSGINWFLLPASIFASHFDDMYVLNQDTIFVVDDDGFYGGVYRTINGGNNWERLIGSPSYLPQKIYMYNGNMGFFSTGNVFGYLYRTTNGGYNWTKIGEEVGFSQITFIDSLTGWKAGNNLMKKSTDGGLSWINQPLPIPSVGYISWGMYHFSIINKDTIWGVGSSYQYPNLSRRGVIYRTTNGGNNWLYQIPDTTLITNMGYSFIHFYNKRIGWSYSTLRGIHTINGGDTTFLSIHKINSEISKEFKLYQNYPNPFNQCTIINVQCTIRSYLEIKVFDISGREITTLINEKKSPGIYEVRFKGDILSSGIYFYSLFVDDVRVDTKKLMLIK